MNLKSIDIRGEGRMETVCTTMEMIVPGGAVVMDETALLSRRSVLGDLTKNSLP